MSPTTRTRTTPSPSGAPRSSATSSETIWARSSRRTGSRPGSGAGTTTGTAPTSRERSSPIPPPPASSTARTSTTIEGSVDAQSALAREFPDKPVYFREGSVFGVSGVLTLDEILRHEARSYNGWVVLLDEHQKPNRGPHEANATAIELQDDGTVRYNPDYFLQGQVTKFLRRGAERLASSAPAIPGFGQVAFRNPAGETALIVANAGEGTQRVAVSCAGERFVAELPARSVATYLWESPGSDKGVSA